MDDRDYEIIMLLAETKNITHAAQRLYMSQSTLSKRIKLMEKELGQTIMLRSRQGVHFTPAGEILITHAKSITQHIRTLKQELALDNGTVHGTLRLGVSINFAHFFLARTLQALKIHYPRITPHIKTNQSRYIYHALWHHQIDAAIVRGEFADWSGQRLHLFSEKICLIYSEKKDIDFRSAPYISRQTDLHMENSVLQWLRENNLSINTLNTGITVDGIQTIVSMVEAGLGWSIVPEICLSHFKGSVMPLNFTNGQPLIRNTYLLYTMDMLALPQLHAFVQFLTHHKGDLYV